jgi:hypothetical protein
MKRLLTVLSLCLTIALGQTIIPIADIQYVPDPAADDASPLAGQTVTISGVVTAEFWGGYKNRTMFVQDADTAWSGIMAYNTGDNGIVDVPVTFDAGVARTILAEGDSVTVTGTVDEKSDGDYTYTRLEDLTAVVVHGKAANPPAPMVVSTLDASSEKYEGCLIKVVDVDVSNPAGDYGTWQVTDGTDDLWIINDGYMWGYYYWPTLNNSLASITGIMNYADPPMLAPRLARDVVEAGPYTRVQRIQQVLGSALHMTPDDGSLDASYMIGDTVTCIGIVTVPVSELSSIDSSDSPWTGYMRFNWQDPNGGPYSGIMSYFDDPTAFPILMEGDSIIITGTIDRYRWFTEMWITEPIQLVAENAHIVEPPLITPDDLLLPITADQWELSMVRLEDVSIVDNSYDVTNAEFTVGDGDGITIINSDGTNEMAGEDMFGNLTTAGPFVIPPNGTTIKSVRGYVYHAYGSYDDNSTYRIRPVYLSDIVLGGGPPTITGFAIAESPLGLTDAVTVSATIADKGDVASAVVTYRVDGGAWMEAAMTEGTDSLWTGTIPATNTEGAFVDYFIKALDDGLDNQDAVMSATLPSDPSKTLYGYHTKAAGPTIHDVQYTPLEYGDSYYRGMTSISLSGVVTSSADQPDSYQGGFVIQDGTGIWNGIWAYLGTATYTVTQGDSITVTGDIVEDYGATVIEEISSVVVHATGKSVAPLELTGAEFVANYTPGESTDPECEKYEGVLIHIGEVVVTDSLRYERFVSDDGGVTKFFLDEDFLIVDSPAYQAFSALGVGDIISDLSGICEYNYGDYVLLPRDAADMGGIIYLSVDDDFSVPGKYSLSQNYPNPFNPVTTIKYSLPRQVKHTLKVYNLRGQLVATLLNDVRPAGVYSITWNASNYASGLYFLRLDAEGFHKTTKMILVK